MFMVNPSLTSIFRATLEKCKSLPAPRATEFAKKLRSSIPGFSHRKEEDLWGKVQNGRKQGTGKLSQLCIIQKISLVDLNQLLLLADLVLMLATMGRSIDNSG